jgi:hypothetical protein
VNGAIATLLSSGAADVATKHFTVPLVLGIDGAVHCQDKQFAICYVELPDMSRQFSSEQGCAEFVAPLDSPDDDILLYTLAKLCKGAIKACEWDPETEDLRSKVATVKFKRDRMTLDRLLRADAVFVAGTALQLLPVLKVCNCYRQNKSSTIPQTTYRIAYLAGILLQLPVPLMPSLPVMTLVSLKPTPLESAGRISIRTVCAV